MTVSADEFMAGVREHVARLPASITTPPEVVEWVHRQYQKVPTPEDALEWETVQNLAGEILVRGTLRHRENDHFVESLGSLHAHAERHRGLFGLPLPWRLGDFDALMELTEVIRVEEYSSVGLDEVDVGG